MSGMEPLMLLAAGGSILGGVVGAQGAKAAGAGQVQQAQADAAASDYNARITRQEAAAEESRRRRESARQLGQIRSGRAKSGVTMEGTPLMVLEESAELAEIDALSARWSGDASAKLDEQRARSARASIPYINKATRYNVGASLLSGIAGAASIGAMR